MFVVVVGMSYGLRLIRESVSVPGYVFFCFLAVAGCYLIAKVIDRRNGL